MATMNQAFSNTESTTSYSQQPTDRLKLLYPTVNEEETPLPRSWSPKDKFTYIGLSQNNLRVHYKGVGKNHKDAASVRATHPIPAACGLYYFEVKIVSKGRDGYMGVGLSAQGVNMNRLPGWDKHSYGYHGDDGHSFCSSGTGQPYGPTFTTGDVIGCGVNLIDNLCFYTKNGHNLGVAFTDLPPNLYPTVGLQTPGEVVDANFGQSPFVFDIEDMMKELMMRTRTTIERFPVNDKQGEWQTTLHRVVQTYLIHHGYCATAEAFARSTGQSFDEDLSSIKNRQRIQKLVLAGRVGEAIETTQRLYPGLLENNPNLLFLLRCRQFVEMVNGTDSEVRPARRSPGSSPRLLLLSSSPKSTGSDVASNGVAASDSSTTNGDTALNGDHNDDDCGTDMVVEGSEGRTMVANGLDPDSRQHNGHFHRLDLGDTDMEVDPPKRQLCGGNQAAMERMLQFGRELHLMSVQLKHQYGTNKANRKMIQDAFSLLAYADPWSSPVGYQLDPVEREPVCAALNSAILESQKLPRRPPLELVIAHSRELLKLMSKAGLGSCAFANIDSLLQ
ncbi:ran-binding protein 9 [Dermacentor andersoni]|uniref:ran-binding protein 9 n=1 Tax=Dermacentor andersoni TaxID=34620 RepID=UPI002155A0B4|nr:ran-binding protein 9-like [Dermacentor andersoni]